MFGRANSKVKRRDEVALWEWLKSQAMTPVVGQRGVLVRCCGGVRSRAGRCGEISDSSAGCGRPFAWQACHTIFVLSLAVQQWHSPDPRPSLLPVSSPRASLCCWRRRREQFPFRFPFPCPPASQLASPDSHHSLADASAPCRVGFCAAKINQSPPLTLPAACLALSGR